VTAGGPGPGARGTCTEWDDGEGRHVRIDWRLRTWQFSFASSATPGEQLVRSFVLRTFYRGAAVAQGRFDLAQGAARRVWFTPLERTPEVAQ
jgi:hypothetical protein